jgi:hypothetical protein
MAQLPVYRQQVLPNSAGAQPRASAGNAGAGLSSLAQGVQGIAQGVEQADRAFLQKQEDDARAWVAGALSSDHVKWLARQKDLEANAQPGAPNFTRDFLKEYDDNTVDSLKNAPDEASRKFYAERRAALRTSLAGSALDFESRSGVQWRLNQAADARENVSQLAAIDPSKAKVAWEEQRRLLGDSAVGVELRRKLDDQVTKAGALGMVERDPRAALDLLNKRIGVGKPGEATGDLFIDGLDAQTLVTLQNRAQSYVAQAENKIKTEADKRDREAKDTIQDLQQFTLNGSMPSPAYSQQVLSKVTGTAYEPAARELLAVATRGAAFGSMTQNQQREQLRAMQAQASAAGTDPESQKVLEHARGIHDKQRQAYEENPWSAATQFARLPAVASQDVGSPGLAAQVVAARLTQINDVEQYAGRSVSPFQPEEAEQFTLFLAKMGPEQKASELGSVGAQLNAGRINALADQLDKKDRPLALALKMGADRTTAGRFASSLVLRGQQAISDKIVKRDDSVLSGWRAELANMVRGTLGDPRAEQDIIDASYYVRAAMDADSSSTPGYKLGKGNEEALKLVAGTPLERQGVKTLTPRGMSEDQFNERLRTYTPEKLKSVAPEGQVYVRGVPISLDALSSGITDYGLRRDGKGRYIPVANNALVTVDKDGTKPLYLSVK